MLAMLAFSLQFNSHPLAELHIMVLFFAAIRALEWLPFKFIDNAAPRVSQKGAHKCGDAWHITTEDDFITICKHANAAHDYDSKLH